MKRIHAFVIACACVLSCVLFCLAGCGGSSSNSASTASSSSQASSSSSSSVTTSSSSSSTSELEKVNPSKATQAEARAVLEQVIGSMSEFYRGSTELGEMLYYAGGADGSNAVLALVEPESKNSAIFVGPAVVGENNKITISDETTGNAISFSVASNEDGTVTFNMGTRYGTAVMSKCSATDIVEALVPLVATAPEETPQEAPQADGAQATQETPGE